MPYLVKQSNTQWYTEEHWFVVDDLDKSRSIDREKTIELQSPGDAEFELKLLFPEKFIEIQHYDENHYPSDFCVIDGPRYNIANPKYIGTAVRFAKEHLEKWSGVLLENNMWDAQESNKLRLELAKKGMILVKGVIRKNAKRALLAIKAVKRAIEKRENSGNADYEEIYRLFKHNLVDIIHDKLGFFCDFKHIKQTKIEKVEAVVKILEIAANLGCRKQIKKKCKLGIKYVKRFKKNFHRTYGKSLSRRLYKAIT